MHHGSLEGYSCTSRESGNMILFRRTRERLRKVAADAGENGNIYINGERFSAAQFRFVLDRLTPPKD